MTRFHGVRPHSRSRRGFILVAVLWILGALATLASIYSVYVGNVAAASHVNDDRLRVRAATQSALELTALKFSGLTDNARPASGSFQFRLDRGEARVQFIDEAARIDINAAKKEVIAGLFTQLGAKSEDAAGFAANIVGWRKSDSGPDQNTEAAAYQSAGFAYVPRQAPFQDPLELRLVRGLPPALIDRALGYLTVYSGQAEIDLRVADPLVMLALPKATPAAVQKVIAARAKGAVDGDALTKLLPDATGASGKVGPTTRVHIDVRLDNGAIGSAEVVIVNSQEDEEPYHIVSWRDDSDGPL